MDEMKNKIDKISQIFATFVGEEDLKDLLLDVCTLKEIEALYQRFRVAQMLRDGRTFVEIERETGISSTTITRVNKCLKNGQGYNKLFDKYNLSINVS
jgi:TrpR-related protein YerC/YecD